MKLEKLLFLWITGLFLMVYSNSSSYAQTYICRIKNSTQLSCNVFEFDVIMQRTGSTVLNLALFQVGINMNAACIPTGGVVNVMPVTGANGSQLIPSQQPAPEKFSFDSDKSCLIVTATAPLGYANATTISNSTSGTKLFRCRVSCSLPFVTGQNLNPAWSFNSNTGYQTKVFAYVGTINTDITFQASHTMTVPYNITFTGSYPAPLAQHITSDITEVCTLPGSGAIISLASTQSGYTYYLYQNGVPVSGSGGVVFGTGSAASFGALANIGVITVKSTSCSGNVDMLNSITLTPLNPVTASVSYTTSPSAFSCQAVPITFTAVPVNGGSNPSFQWYINDIPDYDNGYYDTYTYTPMDGDFVKCEMISSEYCLASASTFSPSYQMHYPECAPPVAYNVTGSGSYCEGSDGLPVGMYYSDFDVVYTITPGGETIMGTGLPVSFGNRPAGTYTISGSNIAGILSMQGSAVITENTKTVPVFSNLGPYCQGDTPELRPAISANGIPGSWNSEISTAIPGTTTYTFTPSAGECATETTMDILVNPTYLFNETHGICSGETYTWHGESLTAAGNYQANYTSINGCDSVYSLTLFEYPPFISTENQSICDGSNYIWHGQSILTSGTYYDHYTSVHGCDSVYVLNATLISTPAPLVSGEQSFCNGATISDLLAIGTDIKWYDAAVGGNLLSPTDLLVNGEICYASQTSNGCESKYRSAATVTFNGAPVTKIGNISICENTYNFIVPVTVDNFNNVGVISLTLTYDHTKLGYPDVISKNPQLELEWGSSFYIETSTPDIIYISAVGDGMSLPDGETLFTLQFNKTTPITGGSLNFYDDGTSCEYAPDAPPDYTPLCDVPANNYYLNGGVTVNPTYSFTENHSICQGNNYSWHDMNLSDAGTYYANYQTTLGCDSIYILNLSYNPSYSFIENNSICEGNTDFYWHGQNLTTEGTYYDINTSANGCDSTYTLNLSVSPVYFMTEDYTINYGDSYDWHDQILTTEGTYTAAYSTVKGCDSVYTINLTVITNKSLSVKVFLEGFYAGYGHLNQAKDEPMPKFADGIADTIRVELHNAASPHGRAYSFPGLNLLTDGSINIASVPANITGSYYIVIRHRNSIETWSHYPIDFSAPGNISYDFTTSASTAYLNNLKPVSGGFFAIYAGDENQDGLIDGSDMAAIDNASTAILRGYHPEDITGDGLVDASDLAIIDNNSTALVSAKRP